MGNCTVRKSGIHANFGKKTVCFSTRCSQERNEEQTARSAVYSQCSSILIRASGHQVGSRSVSPIRASHQRIAGYTNAMQPTDIYKDVTPTRKQNAALLPIRPPA